jgi:medium-chain acyl-[acyl-carrier-protein] hydrolase
VQVCPVQLPGREERLAEPPIAALPELLAQAAAAVAQQLDRPFALLGHSFGALVAYELAHVLRVRRLRPPAALIVSGCRAPDVTPPGPPLHGLPDAELAAAVQRRFGGIPPAALAHAELMRLVLPALRNDLQMAETYHAVPRPPLDCPVLALGGRDDPGVSADDLAGWARQTHGPFELLQMAGGHFFAEAGRADVALAIARTLQLAAPAHPV